MGAEALVTHLKSSTRLHFQAYTSLREKREDPLWQEDTGLCFNMVGSIPTSDINCLFPTLRRAVLESAP